MRDTAFLIYFALAYPVFLFFVARTFIRLYRELPRGQRFYFHITDYWAAIIGCVPSFWLLSIAVDAVQRRGFDHSYEYCLLPYFFGLGQLTGVIIGRVHNQVPDYRNRSTRWSEAGWILCGAALGLTLPFIAAAVVGLLTFILLMAFPLSPFIIMLWIAVRWTRK